MAIEIERIKLLNNLPARPEKKYVLYWMQQSQREDVNHALEYAIEQANNLCLPLLVVFGLTDSFPEANVRHYFFMLQGLQEVEERLRIRNIGFVVIRGSPPEVAINYSKDAAILICDQGYLRHQKLWRKVVSESCSCMVIQVESDIVVPVEVASEKPEFAARTIRRKIHLLLHDFSRIPDKKKPEKAFNVDIEAGIDLSDPMKLLSSLTLDQTVFPVDHFFRGGTTEAKIRFTRFLKSRLPLYVKNGNQPQTDDISHMSPYLHFGQISPLWLLNQLFSSGNDENTNAYIEQLVVRRELAINFVYYTPEYDSFNSLPYWSRQTLGQHEYDHREHVYTVSMLENASTHDPYWNAAMNEMKYTGFMHNYMRMYWGKKVLEWSATPEQAYNTLLYLNNKYFLDGRDPLSYSNVGWIFGLHDRAWQENNVFGKVRIMKASGLKRKFNPEEYLQKVNTYIKLSRHSG